ncbi:MAG: hypothetical protein A2087_02650 [Spirochaetes bacterium GWD1_61_31]|nr:MAG: hypothetical protein A2Y37_03860 [Spirochaetes bacterium GWB1_60_80]OHD43414.1 MAG: hypothetical protein A2087_02650 [Spirochaetes bacterium GWD1_61_31]OHD46601.1 MAG: hypothetical protein A2Y35_14850 [Spirochaetes bacterium GWE1_60_18]OHD61035.1 MAG: hypothetical protein A2Y32_05125 [Spirochaetes bacterium GWF1_60_12]HAP44782.1 phosphoribosylaminoimidazolesuccinocarboxamide synthase [Spirochaetaceae bacterium]
MKSSLLPPALVACYDGLDQAAVPAGLELYRGKVRDVVSSGDLVALVASDRLSAFDRVLTTVPFKGEVLTRVSSWWFERTADIIPNHLLAAADFGGLDALTLSGRCVVGRRCAMLPVEVVVRGYLTGSAWRDYQAGRSVSGIQLPRGLNYCEKFPVPLVTPSTKEAAGHDQPVAGAQIVSSGLVELELWQQVEKTSLALFRRGQELAAERGLILVDTKYEFGLSAGKLTLADEIHTPDSSRYWYADSYLERYATGAQQRELDKETFRRWLLERGFSGDGEAPVIDDAVRLKTASRYIEAYEAITGTGFTPVMPLPKAAEAAIQRILRQLVA